jgi:Ca-activated chloride channel family protein
MRSRLLLQVLLAGSLCAQTAIPPASSSQVDSSRDAAESEFKLTTNVEVVLLDVSVKRQDGGFASGLTKENFKIMQEKAEQPISIFSAQDVPVTVGLVVDNSGSVRPKKPEIVTAALTFVTHSNPKDEVFLVNFNDHVMMGLPDGMDFTDNSSLLRDALLLNPAQGRTALYDALKAGLKHLEKGRLDKKTLVLISDGGDNMSETTKEEILSLVDTSAVTIYTVGIFDAEDKDKNPGFLKRLASITGGEAFMPDRLDHIVGICEKIAKDIRNRYTLGFTPHNVQRDGKPKKIRVTATSPEGQKLNVRTRTHYIPTADGEPKQSSSLVQ